MVVLLSIIILQHSNYSVLLFVKRVENGVYVKVIRFMLFLISYSSLVVIIDSKNYY